MPLRPYQNDLVEQLRAAWREGCKAPCIVLPCGGGKSCILAEIARRTTYNGKRASVATCEVVAIFESILDAEDIAEIAKGSYKFNVRYTVRINSLKCK